MQRLHALVPDLICLCSGMSELAGEIPGVPRSMGGQALAMLLNLKYNGIVGVAIADRIEAREPENRK